MSMNQETDEIKKNQKERAFSLFEQQRYRESCNIIRSLSYHERDTSMQVLEATNLYYLSEFEEARACFLDLTSIIPDSVEVYLYLGRILDALSDDSAEEAFALAVRSDPDNPEALFRYSRYRIASYDLEGAVVLLKRLINLRYDPKDVHTLMEIYNKLGEFEETVNLFETYREKTEVSGEYLRALIHGGLYEKAAKEAYNAYQVTHDICLLRWYLHATTKINLLEGLVQYKHHLITIPDPDIACDYIRVLLENNRSSEAVTIFKEHLAGVHTPACIRAGCRAYTEHNPYRAFLLYQNALSDDSYTGEETPDVLKQMVHEYRLLLMHIYPEGEAKQIFLNFVEERMDTVFLLEAGAFCMETNDLKGARSWLFRAFKTDFITGGLEFIRFLLYTDDSREAEKILLYILKNIRNRRDIEEVAIFVIWNEPKTFSMKRVRNELQLRLYEILSSLSTRGRALYAQSLSMTAGLLLSSGDTKEALIQCLNGLAIVPPSAANTAQELYQTLLRCKDRDPALPDISSLFYGKKTETKDKEDIYALLPDSTPDERKVIAYIRQHSPCYERDIRDYLQTRRAAGIINRLIVRCQKKGIKLIEKDGYGDAGEVYRYVGP